MNSWKVILAAVTIFGCGAVTGGLLVHYAERLQRHTLEKHRPQMLNRQFVQQLDAALHLSPAQREKIGRIIADGQERNRELWKRASPQFRGVMQEVCQRIRAELTPQQREQFEKLMIQIVPPRRPAAQTNAPMTLAPTNLPPAAPASAPARGP